MSAVIEEAARLFAKMDRSEKASALKMLADDTDAYYPGIQKTPGVCGGDACIGTSRIPVWLIWAFHRDGLEDRRILDAYPTLTAEDLVNAYSYARLNLEELEEAIQDNESGEDEDVL